MATCRCFGAYHRASVERSRLTQGGRGGASVCCRVVRLCGADWACVCAVAANASCPGSSPIDSGHASRPKFACRSAGHQRSCECGAVTVECDGASDHHGFSAACTGTGAAKEKPRASSGWRHHNIASPAVIGAVFSSVIVVSNRRSQRGRWNARRAADGKPNRRSWRRAEYAPHYRARRNS
jgi:hypothetical protein